MRKMVHIQLNKKIDMNVIEKLARGARMAEYSGCVLQIMKKDIDHEPLIILLSTYFNTLFHCF